MLRIARTDVLCRENLVDQSNSSSVSTTTTSLAGFAGSPVT